MSKFCGLGQAGFPRDILKCRQISGFPLNIQPFGYPKTGPDYHLVHTAIPNILLWNSLGVFLNKTHRSLASFAKLVSNSDNVPVLANTKTPDPLSTKFTQGRLLCSQHLTIPPNRFNPCSWSRWQPVKSFIFF